MGAQWLWGVSCSDDDGDANDDPLLIEGHFFAAMIWDLGSNDVLQALLDEG